MRVYKVRGFARFQRRERIPDRLLALAVRKAELGLIDADLGGGLVKQRVARSGAGKRSGYRTVIAYRRDQLSIFLLGFAKNVRSNIEDDELEVLRSEARRLLALTRDQLEMLIMDEELLEVPYDEAE